MGLAVALDREVRLKPAVIDCLLPENSNAIGCIPDDVKFGSGCSYRGYQCEEDAERKEDCVRGRTPPVRNYHALLLLVAKKVGLLSPHEEGRCKCDDQHDDDDQRPGRECRAGFPGRFPAWSY